MQHQHKGMGTGCIPAVLLLNHHVNKGKPHLHDGTMTMDLDQEPIPQAFDIMPCTMDVGVVIITLGDEGVPSSENSMTAT